MSIAISMYMYVYIYVHIERPLLKGQHSVQGPYVVGCRKTLKSKTLSLNWVADSEWSWSAHCGTGCWLLAGSEGMEKKMETIIGHGVRGLI